jgi:hypothetical protein
MVVHLCIGVLWNLVALWNPLYEYLVYPNERLDIDSTVMLSNVGNQ